LEIHWTNLVRFDPGGKTTADIFADGYFLGNVEFVEPEQLRCTRSPDGYRIAFSSRSHEIENGNPQIGWIDLRQLPEVHYLIPQILPYDFDFSPDSQQLAVYGCPRQEGRSCGIYIVDLQTGAERLLKTVEQGAELIWSPDGESIAIQGSFLRSGKWRVLIFNAQSGSVIYDGPFDWEGFWVSPDSPIHDWGVQYPPARGGLELCALPPDAE
jgi:dipeptidyl aminopeptidase/acylaminoacyl peptidase